MAATPPVAAKREKKEVGDHNYAERYTALCKWVNHLLDGRFPPIHDLDQDLSDGVALLHLTYLILKINLFTQSRVYVRAKKRQEYIANVEAVFRAFKKRGAQPCVNAQEIVDGYPGKGSEFILQIGRCMYAGYRSTATTFKNAILQKIRTKVRDSAELASIITIATSVEIFNLSTNFSDGTLLLALMYKENPDLFPLSEISKLDAAGRLEKCFEVAFKIFDVPKMLSIKALMSSPDEESVGLWLAMMLHQFKHFNRTEKAMEEMLQERLAEIDGIVDDKVDEKRREIDHAYKFKYAIQAKKMQKNLEKVKSAQELEAAIAKKTIDSMENKLKSLEHQLDDAKHRATQTDALLRKLGAQVQFVKEDAERKKASEVPAPTGFIALMFTDVQGSTRQWEASPDVMSEGLIVHNKTIREVLVQHQGYECKTEGDAFMVSFPSAKNAVECALAIQAALLVAEWPPALLNNKDSLVEYGDKKELLWRGMRVRIGLHQGRPMYSMDPTTKRMDYFGPVVNKSARVESVACGGQIVCSEDVYLEVKSLVPNLVTKDLGAITLKGIKEPVQIYQLSSRALAKRVFNDPGHSGPAESATEVLQAELMKAQKENELMQQKMRNLEDQYNSINRSLLELNENITDQNRDLNREEAAAEVARLAKEQSAIRTQISEVMMVNSELERTIETLSSQHDQAEKRALAMAQGRTVPGQPAFEGTSVAAQKCIDEQQTRIRALEAQLSLFSTIGIGGSHHPLLLPKNLDELGQVVREMNIYPRPPTAEHRVTIPKDFRETSMATLHDRSEKSLHHVSSSIMHASSSKAILVTAPSAGGPSPPRKDRDGSPTRFSPTRSFSPNRSHTSPDLPQIERPSPHKPRRTAEDSTDKPPWQPAVSMKGFPPLPAIRPNSPPKHPVLAKAQSMHYFGLSQLKDLAAVKLETVNEQQFLASIPPAIRHVLQTADDPSLVGVAGSHLGRSIPAFVPPKVRSVTINVGKKSARVAALSPALRSNVGDIACHSCSSVCADCAASSAAFGAKRSIVDASGPRTDPTQETCFVCYGDMDVGGGLSVAVAVHIVVLRAPDGTRLETRSTSPTQPAHPPQQHPLPSGSHHPPQQHQSPQQQQSGTKRPRALSNASSHTPSDQTSDGGRRKEALSRSASQLAPAPGVGLAGPLTLERLGGAVSPDLASSNVSIASVMSSMPSMPPTLAAATLVRAPSRTAVSPTGHLVVGDSGLGKRHRERRRSTDATLRPPDAP